jgi:hypothetical protein
MAKDRRPDRPADKSNKKNGERLEYPDQWIRFGKKELAKDECGNLAVEQEVVPLVVPTVLAIIARRKCARCSRSERLCAEGSAAVIETPPQLWVIYCSRFLTFRSAEAGRCLGRSSFDGNAKLPKPDIGHRQWGQWPLMALQ